MFVHDTSKIKIYPNNIIILLKFFFLTPLACSYLGTSFSLKKRRFDAFIIFQLYNDQLAKVLQGKGVSFNFKNTNILDKTLLNQTRKF